MEGRLSLQTLTHPPTIKEEKKIGEPYRTRLTILLDEDKKKLEGMVYDPYEINVRELLDAHQSETFVAHEKNNSYKKILLFLFLLIFRCPTLLSRPPGFEWIADKFMMVLDQRVMSAYFSNNHENF